MLACYHESSLLADCQRVNGELWIQRRFSSGLYCDHFWLSSPHNVPIRNVLFSHAIAGPGALFRPFRASKSLALKLSL